MEPRRVTCPDCGATREVKCGAGMKVRCPGCGALFFTPRSSVEVEAATSPTVDDTTEGLGDGSPELAVVEAVGDRPPAGTGGTGGGVRVEDAASVTVRRAARPRPPKTSSTEQPAPAPTVEPAPPIPAKVHGRRGGLGSRFYRDRVLSGG